MANETTVNRTFKSTVFIMVFEDKRNLLELYNAMTGKHYTDSEQLEINTLENAVYMSMKNDLSFLIDGRLSLYEHQSTYNPNLPLRFLIYISQLYSGMTRNKNLYGTKTVQIPPPEFVIFYNGEKDMPEKKTGKRHAGEKDGEAVGYVQDKSEGSETGAGGADAQYFRKEQQQTQGCVQGA